jgi:hypothetical protein
LKKELEIEIRSEILKEIQEKQANNDALLTLANDRDNNIDEQLKEL